MDQERLFIFELNREQLSRGTEVEEIFIERSCFTKQVAASSFRVNELSLSESEVVYCSATGRSKSRMLGGRLDAVVGRRSSNEAFRWTVYEHPLLTPVSYLKPFRRDQESSFGLNAGARESRDEV